MAEKKMCPHCGGQMFMAKITRAGVIEVSTDPNESHKILKESKDKFDVEILKCARCKESVQESDLVVGVTCKECGRVVGPMDINTDGICNVCEAVKQRSELANASKEDLIKMLLDAEKKANPVASKMEKQIEKADAVVSTPVVATPDVNDTDVNSLLGNSEESTGEQQTVPKTRGKARKKKDDVVAEAVVTETVEKVESTPEDTTNPIEVTTEESVSDIANQQEAPFPDVMNPPEEETVQNTTEPVVTQAVEQEEEQPIGSDFKMFDDAEDAF